VTRSSASAPRKAPKEARLHGWDGGAYAFMRRVVATDQRAFPFAGVGWNEDADPAVDDVLDLRLMPVARVGDEDLRCVSDAGLCELGLGGVDDRLEVPEVR
jgi:hypothetical protein